MTSDRKLAASRRNAARSTGPRTSLGKARASRNALRHGLAVSLAREPSTSTEIERLARAIASNESSPASLYYARIAAEAELEIKRVRAGRIALINQTYLIDRYPKPERVMAGEEGTVNPMKLLIQGEPERVIVAFTQAVPELAKYDRYENRALSRRKRALRALDNALENASSA